MNAVRFRILWSCWFKRSKDHMYMEVCSLSRTFTATEGRVVRVGVASTTSPKSSKPAMVSNAEAGNARVPPAAIVKL